MDKTFGIFYRDISARLLILHIEKKIDDLIDREDRGRLRCMINIAVEQVRWFISYNLRHFLVASFISFVRDFNRLPLYIYIYEPADLRALFLRCKQQRSGQGDVVSGRVPFSNATGSRHAAGDSARPRERTEYVAHSGTRERGLAYTVIRMAV